jgi:hypothetical protein
VTTVHAQPYFFIIRFKNFNAAALSLFAVTTDSNSIEIEFAYYNGDEAVLKAKRVTSSTAC